MRGIEKENKSERNILIVLLCAWRIECGFPSFHITRGIVKLDCRVEKAPSYFV